MELIYLTETSETFIYHQTFCHFTQLHGSISLSVSPGIEVILGTSLFLLYIFPSLRICPLSQMCIKAQGCLNRTLTHDRKYEWNLPLCHYDIFPQAFLSLTQSPSLVLRNEPLGVHAMTNNAPPYNDLLFMWYGSCSK